jgi:purine-nucleoside phosphorylase
MGIEQIHEDLDFIDNYVAYVDEAANFIKSQLDSIGSTTPEFGVVLGSGLGDLAKEISDAKIIPYKDIPHFPRPTVEGHAGDMYVGSLEGVPIIGLSGRKHYYEEATRIKNAGILNVVFPVHVLANLGVKNYFVTNAAGGLNLKYNVGDTMVIDSHINMIENPLLGPVLDFKRVNDDNKVWRFQPMNEDYDNKLSYLLGRGFNNFANEHKDWNLKQFKGIYLALTGPTYETKGECIAFRDGFKVDAVGMSTAPEVIVAKNRGMRVVGMSCVTNKIGLDGVNATNHDEVKAILESTRVRESLSGIVRNFFALYRESKLRN